MRRILDVAGQRLRRWWLKRRYQPDPDDTRIVDRTIHGIRWILHLREPTDYRMHMTGRLPGDADLTLIQRVLGPGKVALDIGANVGHLALPMAQMGAQVVCFEPNPQIGDRLRWACVLNACDTVALFNWGLGASEHIAFLHIPHDPGSASCGAQPHAKTISIPVKALDEVITQYPFPDGVDFIKIDVEGYECEVLRGAYKTIMQQRPTMLVEVNRQALARMDQTPYTLLSLLINLGYDLYKRTWWGQMVRVYPHQHWGAIYDVWCVPTERAATRAPAEPVAAAE